MALFLAVWQLANFVNVSKVTIWGKDLAEKCQPSTLPVFHRFGKGVGLPWQALEGPPPHPTQIPSPHVIHPESSSYGNMSPSFLGGVYRKVRRMRCSPHGCMYGWFFRLIMVCMVDFSGYDWYPISSKHPVFHGLGTYTCPLPIKMEQGSIKRLPVSRCET